MPFSVGKPKVPNPTRSPFINRDRSLNLSPVQVKSSGNITDKNDDDTEQFLMSDIKKIGKAASEADTEKSKKVEDEIFTLMPAESTFSSYDTPHHNSKR